MFWSLIALASICLLVAARWAVWRGFRVGRVLPVRSPADFGLSFVEAEICAVGGKRLSAWFLEARPGAPLVVVVHGWGANAEAMLPLAVPIRREGFSVLLFDARNHGRSDADTFSSMPRFAEDLEAALIWARRLATAPSAVAVLGHSVGGAAALLVASRRSDIGAVISLSAFDHPERVMRSYLARARIPFVPLGWLVCRYVERVIGHRFDDIAPVTTIAKVHSPVLIGHGADDPLVLPEAARAIHAAATGECQLAVLQGASHEQPVCFEAVGRLIVEFLQRVLLRRNPA